MPDYSRTRLDVKPLDFKDNGCSFVNIVRGTGQKSLIAAHLNEDIAKVIVERFNAYDSLKSKIQWYKNRLKRRIEESRKLGLARKYKTLGLAVVDIIDMLPSTKDKERAIYRLKRAGYEFKECSLCEIQKGIDHETKTGSTLITAASCGKRL